ncbi:MAG: FeoB small GTPase domain-containing protein, partial [Trueperaceae bacterium]|nr:FeoB small GTPase domain-containing protein [Trueperaceae bacterium]
MNACRFCGLAKTCSLAGTIAAGDANVPRRWYLVGTPNTGKTSLVNALAGANLEIGNWSGTTIEVASASAHLACGTVELIDLPGAYTLAGSAPDEEIVLPALDGDDDALVVNVVDATNLERDLTLTAELVEHGRPMVVAVNLADQARKTGREVDPAALEAAFGVPVVEVAANTGGGVGALVSAASRAAVGQVDVPYPEAVARAAGRLQ